MCYIGFEIVDVVCDDVQIGVCRRFVARANARERRNRMCACLLVESLDIAVFACLQVGVDKDFIKISVWKQRLGERPIRSKGRNQRDENDKAVVVEELGELGCAANVFFA